MVKIADMGLAKRIDPEGQASGNHSFHTSAAGTLGWRAPEQVRGERCGKAVDLFAAGCIFFYLLTKGSFTPPDTIPIFFVRYNNNIFF